jgi:hypothetical protein
MMIVKGYEVGQPVDVTITSDVSVLLMPAFKALATALDE